MPVRDKTWYELYIGGEIYPIPKQTVPIAPSPVIFNCNGAGKQTHL
ncbi:hypothetical protein [uncultured Nostoc sp.]